MPTVFEALRLRLKGTRVQEWRITELAYRAYVRLLSRRLPGGPSFVTVPFRGYEFDIERGDITILPTLLSGAYEREEIDALLALVRPGAVFVDVGANVGVFTVLAARAVGPNGLVLAFEPNADVLELLRRNIARAKATGALVEVLPFALSDRNGAASWEQTAYHGTGRLSTEPEPQNAATVESRRLDDVLAERRAELRVGAIKVDVEGFEANVVIGARETILRDKPDLMLEVCGSRSRELGVAWTEALPILAQAYRSATVFGPVAEPRGTVRETIEAVLRDGRLHNVLLRN